MENAQIATTEPVTAQPQQPKNSHGMVISFVIVIVVLAAAMAGVYFWQSQKVDDLTKKNSSLTSQLATAQSANKSSASTTGNTISYKASVGKFTLTLPNKYVVIQRNDGGGEGGPSTSLLIGDKTSNAGVVNSSIWSEVSVTATSKVLGSSSFRTLVDNDLKDNVPSQKDTAVKIDGISAEVYKTTGALGMPKNLYFTKGGIFYKIQLVDTTDAANKQLDAIIAGFKFN